MTAEEAVWGLISDVHGNRPALDDAVRRLSRAGATRLAFLGDYLGRGESDACVERIRALADLAVVGNRDLDWRDRVARRTRDWVLGLPTVAQCGPLLVAHGDERLTRGLSTAEIKRDFLRAWSELEARQARIFAFGHSHQARAWSKAQADASVQQLTGERICLQPGVRYFVNVGTTGLPFPGRGGPSVALLDLTRGELTHVALEGRA
ncbi:MAG: metallophosphoesterase family protein [Chloroflexi bacterium]|nr:metallophosphoesterase family protein [Chloroflexota bacterium]